MKYFLNILTDKIDFFFRRFNWLNITTLFFFSWIFSFLNFYLLTIFIIIFIFFVVVFTIRGILIELVDEDIMKISHSLSFPMNRYVKNCELNLKSLKTLEKFFFNYSFYGISRDRLDFIVLFKKFIIRSRNFSSLNQMDLGSLVLFLVLYNNFLNNEQRLNLLISRNKNLRKVITVASLKLFFRKKIIIISFYYISLLYIFYKLNKLG